MPLTISPSVYDEGTMYTVAVLVMGWSGLAGAATALGPVCNTNARVRSTTSSARPPSRWCTTSVG
jgi:hypothetical protein